MNLATKFLVATVGLASALLIGPPTEGRAVPQPSATAAAFELAQAMVPRTGMMDAQHPMPMNERYLKRFPHPVRVGDLISLPVLDLKYGNCEHSGGLLRARTSQQSRRG